MSGPGFWDWMLLIGCVVSAVGNIVFAVAASRRLNRINRALAWRQRRTHRRAECEISSDHGSVA